MRRLILKALWIILFIAVFSLIVPIVSAVPGWVRTYQGGSLDVLTPRSVVQTLDGGYATAIFGFLRSESASGLVSSYELQILKTDANGAVQWKHSYPTVEDPSHLMPTINTYSDHYVILRTADQGYVVAGSGGQFWLFKVDSQGSILWSKTYQLNDEFSSSSYFYSLVQTNDGGFVLAGSTNTYEGGKDFWLLKTNSVGVAQWNQTFNSGTYTTQTGEVYPCDDEANWVIQTSDGGYALVGSNSLYRKSTSSIVYATWIVKTDAQGKQAWNHGYDLINEVGYGSFIVQTNDGGFAVAGTQNNDFCLFKITSTGQFQWSQIYGDQETDAPCSLVQLEDNGYAIAGTWTPLNTTLTRPTIGLLRTDSAGQTLWIKTYNGKEDATTFSSSQADAMIRTSDGSYAIVGSTTFGSETHQDILFIKTETLEQTLKPTTLPTPLISGATTQNPGQTTEATSNPTESTQTQSPNNSSTPNDETPNGKLQTPIQTSILLIAGIGFTVAIFSTLIIIAKKRKKTSKTTSPKT